GANADPECDPWLRPHAIGSCGHVDAGPFISTIRGGSGLVHAPFDSRQGGRAEPDRDARGAGLRPRHRERPRRDRPEGEPASATAVAAADPHPSIVPPLPATAVDSVGNVGEGKSAAEVVTERDVLVEGAGRKGAGREMARAYAAAHAPARMSTRMAARMST